MVLAEDVEELVAALGSQRVDKVINIALQGQEIDVRVELQLLASAADIAVAEEPVADAEVVDNFFRVVRLLEPAVLEYCAHRVNGAKVSRRSLEGDGEVVHVRLNEDVGTASQLLVPELLEDVILVLVETMVNHYWF